MAQSSIAATSSANQLQLHLKATKALLDDRFLGTQHKRIREAITALIEKLQINCSLERETCITLSKKLSEINLQINQYKRTRESFQSHLDQIYTTFCRDAVIESVGLPPF